MTKKIYEGVEYEVIHDPGIRIRPCFRVVMNGRLLPHSWQFKLAAEAGAQTEIRRLQKKGERLEKKDNQTSS